MLICAKEHMAWTRMSIINTIINQYHHIIRRFRCNIYIPGPWLRSSSVIFETQFHLTTSRKHPVQTTTDSRSYHKFHFLKHSLHNDTELLCLLLSNALCSLSLDLLCFISKCHILKWITEWNSILWKIGKHMKFNIDLFWNLLTCAFKICVQSKIIVKSFISLY